MHIFHPHEYICSCGKVLHCSLAVPYHRKSCSGRIVWRGLALDPKKMEAQSKYREQYRKAALATSIFNPNRPWYPINWDFRRDETYFRMGDGAYRRVSPNIDY